MLEMNRYLEPCMFRVQFIPQLALDPWHIYSSAARATKIQPLLKILSSLSYMSTLYIALILDPRHICLKCQLFYVYLTFS